MYTFVAIFKLTKYILILIFLRIKKEELFLIIASLVIKNIYYILIFE